jgi:hypothetical protein
MQRWSFLVSSLGMADNTTGGAGQDKKSLPLSPTPARPLLPPLANSSKPTQQTTGATGDSTECQPHPPRRPRPPHCKLPRHGFAKFASFGLNELESSIGVAVLRALRTSACLRWSRGPPRAEDFGLRAPVERTYAAAVACNGSFGADPVQGEPTL